jgi:ankyrin repeat protein
MKFVLSLAVALLLAVSSTPMASAFVRKPKIDFGEEVKTTLTVEEKKYFSAVDHGELETVKQMLADGIVDINVRDTEHRTGLQRAIIEHQDDVGIWLLKNGVDYEDVDTTFLDPLHSAAKYDRHIIMHYLLEDLGIHPNTKNKDGLKPIHRAALGLTSDAAKTMDIIWDHGINIDELDERHKTALSYAIAVGNKDTIDWLLSKGASLYYLSRKEQKKLHKLAPEIAHEL